MIEVIYSQFMEPITVVDLDPNFLEKLYTKNAGIIVTPYGKIHISVLEFTFKHGNDEVKHKFIATLDEELALKLPMAYLPGQRRYART
jgi:hypothetical protein